MFGKKSLRTENDWYIILSTGINMSHMNPLPGNRPLDQKEVQQMNKYEVMYILKADLEEEARKALVDQLHNIIVNDGGEVTNVDEWGLRDFAYEIDGMNKGYYVVTTFDGTPEAVAEFDRICRINANVVRSMILNLNDVK